MIKIYKYKYNDNLIEHFIQLNWSNKEIRKIYKDGSIGPWNIKLLATMEIEFYIKDLVELNSLELSVLKAQGILNDL